MSTTALEYGKLALLGLLVAGTLCLANSKISIGPPSTAASTSAKGNHSAPPVNSGLAESTAYSDWDYIDGKKHMENQRYEEAVKSFGLAMKSNKRNSYAAYQRGLAYIQLKKYDEAIADFTKSIATNPTNKDFYFARSEAYRDKKEFDKAIEDCKVVIKEFGDSAEAQQHIALSYIDKDDFSSALSACDKAISLSASDSYNWNLRGVCDEGLKQPEKAIADYSKSIGLLDTYAEPLFNRGVIYLDRKDYQKALNDFDRIVKIGQAEGKHYYNRSLAYAGLGRKALADADLKKCKELKYDPNASE